jgi:outer membrane protein assembly factor BamD (BamD/ComL family)
MIPVLFLAAGCVSNPAEIGADLSPAELIQRGQEATDRNRYAQALNYYGAILERYPSYIDAVCAAEYEIAFIHYKQRKYDMAKTELQALLARYDAPDQELLPPQFRRLAVIVLERIAEREK